MRRGASGQLNLGRFWYYSRFRKGPTSAQYGELTGLNNERPWTVEDPWLNPATDSAYVLDISNGVSKLVGELDVDEVNDFLSTPPDEPRRHPLPRGVQPYFHEAGFPCN